jgi:hypothetical protein
MISRRPESDTLRRGGYTLIELLVVCGISVLLMSVLIFIYANSLKVYRESQGMNEVLATAKIINKDLRDYLGNVIAIPGKYVNPMPGTTKPYAANFGGSIAPPGPAILDPYYVTSVAEPVTKLSVMSRAQTGNALFTYAQFPFRNASPHLGYARGVYSATPDAETWSTQSTTYFGLRGWWMPGFFGARDGTSTTTLESNDIKAGSWGWPRPDYRMDIDLDDPAGGTNCACWFYAENRKYNSPYTLALDNANVVLVSLKFSARRVDGKEQTMLSILRHQIVGFDTATKAPVVEEQTLANMLRSFKITPYYLDAGGMLQKMEDAELGCAKDGTFVPGGDRIPRCFDIEYTLRNPANLNPNKFSLRIYCPQTAR